jgi:hypothetical protein
VENIKLKYLCSLQVNHYFNIPMELKWSFLTSISIPFIYHMMKNRKLNWTIYLKQIKFYKQIILFYQKSVIIVFWNYLMIFNLFFWKLHFSYFIESAFQVSWKIQKKIVFNAIQTNTVDMLIHLFVFNVKKEDFVKVLKNYFNFRWDFKCAPRILEDW